MTKRTVKKKLRLAKANRQIKRLPVFVMARTKRAVTHNRRTRNWRTSKLGITDE